MEREREKGKRGKYQFAWTEFELNKLMSSLRSSWAIAGNMLFLFVLLIVASLAPPLLAWPAFLLVILASISLGFFIWVDSHFKRDLGGDYAYSAYELQRVQEDIQVLKTRERRLLESEIST